MSEKNLQKPVNVIGAGLAGCEAVWQLIKNDIPVTLYEMRPVKQSPAHHTSLFAELVCSNSLRANNIENAVGLLKEEMRLLGSLIMEAADNNSLPAGGALAVDRTNFSSYITNKIKNHPLVTICYEEITDLTALEGITIVASGPLTSDALAESIKMLTGDEYLYFYDAAAPIVSAESLNYDKVFRASRYDKGDADYLNCPMTKEEYLAFWQELTNAEVVQPKSFEKEIFFEGCMPIEEMARRGVDTIRFGPLKPVGLVDSRTNLEAYAVVQLRQDNTAGSLYNLVGFQTHLKWGEQKRIFAMIPGLENAEFVRLGVMHRNTYINSPALLNDDLSLKCNNNILFAGQITGVEGYVESAASGLIAGMNAVRIVKNNSKEIFPEETAHGALTKHICTAPEKTFQPMNINWGIFPPLKERIRNKKLKNEELAKRALELLNHATH